MTKSQENILKLLFSLEAMLNASGKKEFAFNLNPQKVDYLFRTHQVPVEILTTNPQFGDLYGGLRMKVRLKNYSYPEKKEPELPNRQFDL